MDYAQTLEWLYSRLPYYQRDGAAPKRKINLEATLKFCQHLGFPNMQLKAVHVAGTNGKGTSTAMIAAIAQAAGYKVGMFTSPHLKDFTERIRIDGANCDQDYVVRFVAENKTAIEQIGLSFFELTACMAFDYFVEKDCDLAVIEVGLGGRLDSTNVIQPLASLITNISFDHSEVLGDTLAKIAREKAGIIKQRIPVAIGARHPETEEVFEQVAREQQAPVTFAEDNYQVEEHPGGLKVFKGPALVLQGLVLGLKGDYVKANLPGVLEVIDLLRTEGFRLPERAVKEGLEKTPELTGIKGRWQTLRTQPKVVVDVAHNPAAVERVIAQAMAENHRKLHLVVGFVKGKDSQEVLNLLPEEASFYFTQPRLPRALPVEELHAQALLVGREGEAFLDVNAALVAALAAAHAKDLILVTGSTFIVADIEGL